MDERDDLERRLAGRLRPARVLGADETWHRLAPRLGDSSPPNALLPQRFRSLLALYVATLALVFVFVLASPGRPGIGVTPPTAPATPRIAAPQAGASVRVVGAGVVSVQPALPFTLWQPGYRVLGENLTAYAYRSDATQGNAPGVASAVVNTRGDGRANDPAVVAVAERRSRKLLGDGAEATLVLLYAADPLRVGGVGVDTSAAPARLFTVAQRPASGRSLPPGEAAWFSGTSATFVRAGDQVVLSWLAGDTSLTLTTDQTPEQAVVFAGSLKPTALVAPGVIVPTPTPTLTIPTPLPLALTPRATAIPCPNATADTVGGSSAPATPPRPQGRRPSPRPMCGDNTRR